MAYYTPDQRIIRTPDVFLPVDDVLKEDGKRYAVVEIGGRFHAWLVNYHWPNDDGVRHFAITMKGGAFYRPVHKSNTLADVVDARYAWDKDGAWMFAHCSPDEQIDFAAEARTFTSAQFQLAIADAQVKMVEATNPQAQAVALKKAKALIAFAKSAGEAAAVAVIAEHSLGHFHRDPHHDHKRDLARAAVAKVLAEWKKEGLTAAAVRAQRDAVLADAGKVTATLSSTHTIKTRPEMAALAAAKKKEAEAEAPAEPEENGE